MRPLLTFALLSASLFAAEPPSIPPNGDALLKQYFEQQVAAIEKQQLPSPKSAAEWEKTRVEWRGELADMLGLKPMPARTPLQATKTGEVAGDGFVVENIHFQSMPGLYVTANLYRPAVVEKPLPTILYGCGHSHMKAKDGGSLGNKAGYQHHGAWFARHGYVCLVIDTVQLGEIRGEHHGTYSKGRWWWMARGYTPAGVEAWAGIRALDYLETRPEVDKARIGMTGRSGGGAYSWWVAALDDRIAVVAPTAGITTLRNHVVDGAVEGHCDCMFMVNTRRWDYDKVAALIAPRPLLISNTDKDTIFPLDGVMTIYNRVRGLYKALGAEAKIGLQIAEGPHKDTQSLNVGAFAWFERFLKGADVMDLIDEPARKLLDPEVLRVFKELPTDEINTRVDETFVKAAGVPRWPFDLKEFETQRDGWMQALREEVFAGWPASPGDLHVRKTASVESYGVRIEKLEFTTELGWELPLYVVLPAGQKPDEIGQLRLCVLNEEDWGNVRRLMHAHMPQEFPLGKDEKAVDAGNLKQQLLALKMPFAFLPPRGIGPSAFTKNAKAETHRLRRFYLLGQTLDGMRVWDIRRGIAALREIGYGKSVELFGNGPMGANALYASLFEDNVKSLELDWLPTSHREGPTYLNVLRTLDIPEALLMVAARADVRVSTDKYCLWEGARGAARAIGREKALRIDSGGSSVETK